MRVAIVLMFACAAACTKANPAVNCTGDGTCIDPAFPFCDVAGQFGDPGTCVAVMCTAGEFGGCQDANTALTCDASGKTFDPTACQNGCDQASGCITCTQSTQSCANDVQTTCDANGKLSMTTCALGCFDATRCAEIDPSNGLGTFYGMVPSPQDLDLENGTLDLDASTFDDGTTVTPIPGFLVPAPSGGAPIRVYVIQNLTLGDITITSTTVANGGIGDAVAFLATKEIHVAGRVAVESGAVDTPGCTGTGGLAINNTQRAGAGGGAFATDGANGGEVGNTTGNRGIGGSKLAGTAGSLTPLRGGCPGAGVSGLGGHGGGAIQLVSQTTVVVDDLLVADGNSVALGGGGAGGGVLIEAPMVVLNATGGLLVRGGGGASGLTAGKAPTPPDNASPPPGGPCTDPHCGAGGDGATIGIAATVGGNTGIPNDGLKWVGGSGGGGLGFVRVNTRNGAFQPDPAAIVAGQSSTGRLATK